MKFPFYDRVQEYGLLLKMFKEETLNRKSFVCVITGQKNSGKTELVTQFINGISNDIIIGSQIPDFKQDRNVITFQCDHKSKLEPYGAFIFITNQILKNQKNKQIFSNLFKVVLSASGVDSTLSALVQLSKTLKSGTDNDLSKEEIKRFKNYNKFLTRLTSKTPIIFHIKDVQYLDDYSLKLIENILYDPTVFCGAIIFEMNESEGDSYETIQKINNFVKVGKISKIQLTPLDQSFPAKMMGPIFGDNFLNQTENDTLFANSKGLPGNLVNLVDEYIQNEWLTFVDGIWKKKEDFEEKIKPKNQQLIDVLILFHADGEISDSEMKVAKTMAKGWDFKQGYVDFCAKMISSIAGLGYKIERLLPWGLVSEYVFHVMNQNGEPRIIEYLHTNKKELPPRKNNLINHVNLVEALSVTQCDDSIIIEWDFFEGKRMRDLLVVKNTIHLENCLRLLKEIIKGLSELHKYNIIHNYITPEAIIESNDGRYLLATLDSNLIGFLRNNCKSLYDDSIYYSAPELLGDGKPTTRSDIYSMGILLYKLITNSLPFMDLNLSKSREQILNSNLDFTDLRGFNNNEALVSFFTKCLSKDPSERFSNLDEMLANMEKLTDGNYVQKTEKVSTQKETLPERPVKRKFVGYLFKSAIVIVLLIITYFAFFRSNTLIDVISEKKNIDQIVVDISIGQDSASFGKPVVRDVVEFLMQEEILRSANISVLSGSQFKKLREATGMMTLMPKLWIKGNVTKTALGYELGISIVDNGNTIKETVISFIEPATFLTGQVKPFVLEILKLKQINIIKNIPVTNSWDAIENYVIGSNAWFKMDKNNAKNALSKAISFDPNFTLAKLKYLEVLKFEGGNSSETDALMKELKTNLSDLSSIDSIRVLAVEKTTQGKFRESIPYYRQIAEKLPQNKYSFYEIAGAYNQFLDNDNAIEYYLKALEKDTNFALALNHLAYSYMNKFEIEKAFSCFRRYVELDKSANAYDGLADCFYSAGMIDSAIFYKKRGISLDASLEYLQSGLGLFYTMNREFEKASTAFHNYATLVKGNKELSKRVNFFLAFNEYSANKLEEAEKILNESGSSVDKQVEILDFPEILWLQGMISFDKGEYKNLDEIISKLNKLVTSRNFSKDNYHPVYKYYVFLRILESIASNDMSKRSEFLGILNNDLKFKVKDNGSVFDFAYLSHKLFQIFSTTKFKDGKAALEAKNHAISANPLFLKFSK